MINPRESLDLLLASPKLEDLIKTARVKAARLEGKKTGTAGVTASKVAELRERVDEARRFGQAASDNLRALLETKRAQREEKVAIVRHLFQFGSKLLSA